MCKWPFIKSNLPYWSAWPKGLSIELMKSLFSKAVLFLSLDCFTNYIDLSIKTHLFKIASPASRHFLSKLYICYGFAASHLGIIPEKWVGSIWLSVLKA